MDGGGGGGGTYQIFVRGCSAPRSKPLPIYIPLLTKNVSLLYTVKPVLNGHPRDPTASVHLIGFRLVQVPFIENKGRIL